MPSPSTINWLLVPKVVGPPAWLVLIVSPVFIFTPVDWFAGALPVAMMVGSVIVPVTGSTFGLATVNIRNRFCPEGAPARLNSRSWLAPTKTLSSRLMGSSGLVESGFLRGAYCTDQILAPDTGDPVSSR